MKKTWAVAASGVFMMSMTACGSSSDKAETKTSVATSVSSAAVAPSSAVSPSGSSTPSSAAVQPSTSVPAVAPASTPSPAVTPAHSAAPAPITRTHSVAPKPAAAANVAVPPPTDAQWQQMSQDPAMSNDSAVRACSPGITANTQTSCGFAEAVAQAWGSHGQSSKGVIYVKSPATGATYGVRCESVADYTSCMTSKRAYVGISS